MRPVFLVPTISTTVLAAAIATTACTRKAAAPEAQSTTGPQPRAESVQVTGCLRAGLADNTFVLAVVDSSGASTDPTTNYQLTGSKVNLRDYIGQQVNVSGTVRSEQEIAMSSGPTTQKPAKGTSGTPTVETKEELDVKQLVVDTVSGSGQRCAPDAAGTRK